MLPKGIVASGFPRVRETCRHIGITFDPWQSDLNKCLLAKTADGLYAADTAVISISRQVGKTFDIGAVVFAECIAEPGTTVIWTAHRFKVARETFNELRSLAKSPLLAPHLDYDTITTAAGNECIPFRNGSRIVFAARERGAIRGFTKVRILILDEAQILTDAALADLAPTMNQAANPLIILMGTPPKPSDPSDVFTGLRADALAGTSEGVLYVEMSADPGADPDDREQWAKANPSYPVRTPARAMMRLRKLLSEDDFRREAMGVWDSDGRPSIFGSKWLDCFTPDEPPAVGAIGVAVSVDRLLASIGTAGLRSDGCPHVGSTERRPGTSWAVTEAVRIQLVYNCLIVIDEKGPAGDLIDPIEEIGGTVVRASLNDYLTACSTMFDRVQAGGLTHGATDELDADVRAASWRYVSDRRAFARKGGDVSMLEAVALAMWAVTVRADDLSPVNNVW